MSIATLTAAASTTQHLMSVEEFWNFCPVPGFACKVADLFSVPGEPPPSAAP